MFKGSEKEYELLKGETDTIKKSILQFIGFIISIAGIAVAIAKIFSNPTGEKGNSLIILGAIVGGLVVITLLFEIIWYKFKSHNRYVGYIQLLTQEVGCADLTDDIKKRESTANKSYFDDIKITGKPEEFSQTLFTWEYMMARYHSAHFENSKIKIPAAIEKIHFKFRIPDTYKYEFIKPEYRDVLVKNYIRYVVQILYSSEKSFSNKVWDKLHNGFWGFLDLYIPIRRSFYKKRFKKLKREYLTTGWLFPKKVIQVVFFPITLLLIIFYYILFSNYRFNINLTSDYVSLPVTAMSILVFGIGIVWVFRYIGGLKSLIFGKHSAEYFSWAFFIFRVQLLNSYNIFPIYFSRNFIRYLKLVKTIEEYDQLYGSLRQIGTAKCPICLKKKDEHMKLTPSLVLPNPSLEKQFKAICIDCNDLYKQKITSASIMPKELISFNVQIEKVINPKNGI